MSKVYLGDCLEIMPDIPDKSIDMILCDYPYRNGMSFEELKALRVQNKKMECER
jgi:DNA modification methylase